VSPSNDFVTLGHKIMLLTSSLMRGGIGVSGYCLLCVCVCMFCFIFCSFACVKDLIVMCNICQDFGKQEME
jgi:hypothetical protein